MEVKRPGLVAGPVLIVCGDARSPPHTAQSMDVKNFATGPRTTQWCFLSKIIVRVSGHRDVSEYCLLSEIMEQARPKAPWEEAGGRSPHSDVPPGP